jgi:hypothetical protein
LGKQQVKEVLQKAQKLIFAEELSDNRDIDLPIVSRPLEAKSKRDSLDARGLGNGFGGSGYLPQRFRRSLKVQTSMEN